MSEQDFKSAISDTISNLLSTAKGERAKNTLDYGTFLIAIKKEMIKTDLPFYGISRSDVNKNIIILELPFCKSCEIAITPTMFGSNKKEASIKINGILTRRIRLGQFDAAYMNQVAIALIDYLKRFLIVKNKITNNK
jgi:hypothetical protein